jgi:hypothetical protein
VAQLDIKLTYTNNDNVTVQARKDVGTWFDVVHMDENGHMADVWPDFEAICMAFLRNELVSIGNIMKGA